MFRSQRALVVVVCAVMAGVPGCGIDLSSASIRPPAPAPPPIPAASAEASLAFGQLLPPTAPTLIPLDVRRPLPLPGIGAVVGLP